MGTITGTFGDRMVMVESTPKECSRAVMKGRDLLRIMAGTIGAAKNPQRREVHTVGTSRKDITGINRASPGCYDSKLYAEKSLVSQRHKLLVDHGRNLAIC